MALDPLPVLTLTLLALFLVAAGVRALADPAWRRAHGRAGAASLLGLAGIALASAGAALALTP